MPVDPEQRAKLFNGDLAAVEAQLENVAAFVEALRCLTETSSDLREVGVRNVGEKYRNDASDLYAAWERALVDARDALAVFEQEQG